MTADHSLVSFCYFHAADDNIKVDSSRSTYEHITVLQGDIGAAIELGTYGIGLRSNAVRGTRVSGVYVHRITQESTMDDGLGSLIGSRTCPWGITLAPGAGKVVAELLLGLDPSADISALSPRRFAAKAKL